MDNGCNSAAGSTVPEYSAEKEVAPAVVQVVAVVVTAAAAAAAGFVKAVAEILVAVEARFAGSVELNCLLASRVMLHRQLRRLVAA